jgi:hypothetical protein
MPNQQVDLTFLEARKTIMEHSKKLDCYSVTSIIVYMGWKMNTINDCRIIQPKSEMNKRVVK